MKLSIVGATGLVGRTMLRILEERDVPVASLLLLASERSAGVRIPFRGQELEVHALAEGSIPSNTIALFSAGGETSRVWAPRFAAAGNIVIDNSSTWRMDPDVPLVVPGVNDSDVLKHRGIIANPNCSTIQMVPVLAAIHAAYGLKRVVVSTYQSPSGAGQKGVDQLQAETRGQVPTARIAHHSLAYNTVFHNIGGVGQSSEEEVKMQRETRRILHMPHLPMAVTCVRVPVLGGHAESIAIETTHPLNPDIVRAELGEIANVVVADDPAAGVYPTPQLAAGTDTIFVGRIRRDDSVDNGILLWVVADNLRVGAATNAIRIADLLSYHNA